MTEFLVGNLTRDPELRYTPSGKAVVSLRVAVNERHKNDQGEWVNGEPKFYDVTVWDNQAEHVNDALRKGDRIIAIGSTKTRTWESDGETKSKDEFIAQDIGPSLKFDGVTLNS